MSRAAVGIGFGGGFFNTVIETRHAVDVFIDHLGESVSANDAIGRLFRMDEATFVGLIVYGVVLASTWLPLLALIKHHFHHEAGLPVIGLGLMGSIINTALSTHYALGAIWLHFGDASSGWDLLVRIFKMDDAALVGICVYLANLAATWWPIIVLIKNRLRGTPKETNVNEDQPHPKFCKD